MSNDRKVAAELLVEAVRTITQDRPGVHGSAEDSFEYIGKFWSLYLEAKYYATTGERTTINVTAYDVAQMMSMLKKMRATFGDPTNRDNYVDDVGYTGLAGMISLPEPTHPGEKRTAPIFQQPPMREPTFGGQNIGAYRGPSEQQEA